MLARMTPDHEWARERVATFPASWQGRILAQWGRKHKNDRTGANLGVLRASEGLGALRLPLDATDETIRAAADEMAQRCMMVAQVHHQPGQIRAAMGRLAAGQGVDQPEPKITDAGAIARMTDPLWWRGKLRRFHGRQVEAAAIDLGYVHRHAEIYASTLTVQRRAQQIARNVEMLEGTEATNEHGQTYTLAELAAKGSGNKAIRRAELMTRIAGFERIARDLGHAGLFLTITCPSRMHKKRQVNHGLKCIDNPNFDGTTPREAQAYLAGVWARIRAALHRRGVGLYGFRIAEPQHDGTPHWHLLVFHAPVFDSSIRALVRKYALQDSPDEPGAQQHRCDFKAIDWERGSAAGYIAKYIAKNIDGYKVETDLYGHPTMETTQRVEAWASTWGIRQFQQVGGPPVTVWRELRRVEAVPSDAPAHLIDAHNAVNKLAQIEGRENASVAWDRYCKAQGGVFCGRAYRIRVEKREQPGVLNRYGEQAGKVPYGVSTMEFYTPAHMRHLPGATAERRIIVESRRYEWQIKRANAAHGEVSIARAKPAPWTCVNNCTEGVSTGHEADERAARTEPGEAGGKPNCIREHEHDVSGGFRPGDASGFRWGSVHVFDDRDASRQAGQDRGEAMHWPFIGNRQVNTTTSSSNSATNSGNTSTSTSSMNTATDNSNRSTVNTTTVTSVDSGSVLSGEKIALAGLSNNNTNTALVLALADNLFKGTQDTMRANVSLARDLAGGASAAYSDATSQASGTKNIVMVGLAVVGLAAAMAFAK